MWGRIVVIGIVTSLPIGWSVSAYSARSNELIRKLQGTVQSGGWQAGGAPGVFPPSDVDGGPHALPAPVLIHKGLKPGDVIAWGKPMRSDHAGPNDDCVYNFGVEITITSGSRTVGLRKGPECTVVLDRIIDVDVISDHAASARRP
jgi:hypothetical protein